MKKRSIIILLSILIIVFVISLFVGQYKLTFLDIIKIISGQLDGIKKSVFLKIRLPRNVFVLIAGCGLALAGFIYQAIFKNSLASPDILGVSSGASVGAIIGILFFNNNKAAIQIFAFILGILVVIIAFLLSKIMKGEKIYNLVIAGIIVGALANSAIMFMKYNADPERELATIDYWLMGSFHTIKWIDVLIMAPMVIISGAVLVILNKKIVYLTLNELEAKSLGINVKLLRYISLILSTIIVSSIVSIVGVISFIGLIVPHMVRLIFKENFKYNMLQSILLGASILLIADMLARSISKSEIPISIFTSMLGAVVLLIFMSSRRKV